MYCSQCGSELPDDAMFCGECRAQTRNYRRQQEQQRIQEEQRLQQPYVHEGGPRYQEPPYYDNQWSYQEPPYYGNQRPYQEQPYQGAAAAKAKFSGGSKRGIITVAVFLGIAVLAGLLYAFVLKPSTPQDTVKKLEKAIEDLDINGIIECFDEETRQSLKEEMSQYGGGEQALSSLLGIAGSFGIGPDVTLRIADIDYADNSSCRVYLQIEMSFMGETMEDTDVLAMRKEGRKWVIDGAMANEILGSLGGIF